MFVQCSLFTKPRLGERKRLGVSSRARGFQPIRAAAVARDVDDEPAQVADGLQYRQRLFEGGGQQILRAELDCVLAYVVTRGAIGQTHRRSCGFAEFRIRVGAEDRKAKNADDVSVGKLQQSGRKIARAGRRERLVRCAVVEGDPGTQRRFRVAKPRAERRKARRRAARLERRRPVDFEMAVAEIGEKQLDVGTSFHFGGGGPQLPFRDGDEPRQVDATFGRDPFEVRVVRRELALKFREVGEPRRDVRSVGRQRGRRHQRTEEGQ